MTLPSEAIKSFTLTAKQKEVRAVFATAAKFFLVYGGSRSGKTFLTIYAIIVRMLKAPGSRHVVFRNDGVDAKQSIGNETVPAVIEMAFPGLVLKWNDQDGYYQAPNGSQLWLAGLKDKARLDKVLGKEFVTIYLNEASQITLEAFRVVQTRLAQTVKDANGNRLPLRMFVDLNPTVEQHWTYQVWVNGLYPEDGRPIPDFATAYRSMVINPKDNAENLPADYLQSLENLPERMRRRFYDGKFTADDDNALWRRAWIKRDSLDEYGRIVVALDPAMTNKPGSDETGIIAAAKGGDNRGYVLADESGKYRPEEWARRAISLYDTLGADCIVAEVNQGGELVEAMIKAEARGRTIPFKAVHATRGKHVRAEPIAGLYEQGKVRHADTFPELENQMCAFTVDLDRKDQGYSPDRVDALVWAMTDLFPAMVSAPPKAIAPMPQRVGLGAGRRF